MIGRKISQNSKIVQFVLHCTSVHKKLLHSDAKIEVQEPRANTECRDEFFKAIALNKVNKTIAVLPVAKSRISHCDIFQIETNVFGLDFNKFGKTPASDLSFEEAKKILDTIDK